MMTNTRKSSGLGSSIAENHKTKKPDAKMNMNQLAF
jgi:hypothetical protein